MVEWDDMKMEASLPSLGAWIETRYIPAGIDPASRSLHWERGLKLDNAVTSRAISLSLPSLGAWIETGSLRV